MHLSVLPPMRWSCPDKLHEPTQNSQHSSNVGKGTDPFESCEKALNDLYKH